MFKPRKVPDEMEEHTRNEYKRRGSPAASTRWGPEDMKRYLRWQISNGQPIGGYSHKLPQASANKPAPMCPHVVAWERAAGVAGAGQVVRQAPPPPELEELDIPTDGYQTILEKKKWLLCHPSFPKVKMPLKCESGEKPALYKAPAGEDVVFTKAAGPQYAESMFQDFMEKGRSKKPAALSQSHAVQKFLSLFLANCMFEVNPGHARENA